MIRRPLIALCFICPCLSLNVRGDGDDAREEPAPEECSPFLSPDLIQDYPAQQVKGPIQADEALLLHAIVRTSNVKRILELGGLDGFSARVFLDALKCKGASRLYTVDIDPIASQDHGLRHKAIQMDAAQLQMSDLDGLPVDLLFLDCHNFAASQNTYERMVSSKMLSKSAFIVLHDTGLHMHPSAQTPSSYVFHGIHQPVERIFAQWLSQRGWDRVSFHDDFRGGGGRHGVTLMQRKVDLSVPCDADWHHPKHRLPMDVSPEVCHEIQQATQHGSTDPEERPGYPEPVSSG